jgi:hypothetical protein
MMKPREAPLNRPSVSRQHVWASPAPIIAPVGPNNSGIPFEQLSGQYGKRRRREKGRTGPPFGPRYLNTTAVPALISPLARAG